MIPIKHFIILALLLALVQKSLALPDDRQQEMDISSDTWEFDIQRGVTTFLGNVVLQQGSLNIVADKVVYHGKYEGKDGRKVETAKIIATGAPASFQQIPEIGAKPVTAKANRLEYNVKNETLYLIEDASLDQDGTILKGNRIVYDVQKSLVKAGNGASSIDSDDRVRMVIPPKVLRQVDGESDQEQNEEEADDTPSDPDMAGEQSEPKSDITSPPNSTLEEE